MSKYIKYIILSLIIIFCFFPELLFAQACSEHCYPYQFCPGVDGQTKLFCASCPIGFAQSHNLTVYKPGLPKCYTVTNNFNNVVVTFGKLYDYTAFQSGNQDQYVKNAGAWAESQFAILCPNDAPSDCCLEIILTTNSQLFKDAKFSPSKTAALTAVAVNVSNCAQQCNPSPKTYLNFSEDFLTEGKFQGVNTQSLWVDEAIAYTPYQTWGDVRADGITIINLSDLLMHELGHYLGYPSEARVEKEIPYCALDGFLQYVDPNEPRKGLTDLEKCWFKQLYCPADPNCISLLDACSFSDVRSTLNQTDPFLLISIIPNPSIHQILITYSLQQTSLVRLDLFDIQGKNMRSAPESLRSAGRSSLELNLDGLAAGSYYARIVVDGIPHTFKIIKTN